MTFKSPAGKGGIRDPQQPSLSPPEGRGGGGGGGLRNLLRWSSFARSTADEGKSFSPTTEEGLLHLKMKILLVNPAIYQVFLDQQAERGFYKHYTHWALTYELHRFLDNDVRIPEMREEILSLDTSRQQKSRLIAYLKGESSPPSQTKRYLGSRKSPRSVHELSEQTMEMRGLALPSLTESEEMQDSCSYSDSQRSSSSSSVSVV
jgi:hypothetical protein